MGFVLLVNDFRGFEKAMRGRPTSHLIDLLDLLRHGQLWLILLYTISSLLLRLMARLSGAPPPGARVVPLSRYAKNSITSKLRATEKILGHPRRGIFWVRFLSYLQDRRMYRTPFAFLLNDRMYHIAFLSSFRVGDQCACTAVLCLPYAFHNLPH